MNKLKLIILVLTGILCGFLQSSVDLPVAAFAAFAPVMFFLERADSRKPMAKTFCGFFLPYIVTQLFFLIFAQEAAPFSHAAATLLLIAAVLLLTAMLFGFMFLPLSFYPKVKTKYPMLNMCLLALFWSLGEWLTENIPIISFPWSTVSLTAVNEPLLLGTAKIFGGSFVSFVILFSNGLLALAVTSKKRITPVVLLAGVTAVNLGLGAVNMHYSPENRDEKITVICVQDSAEGDEKNKIPPYEAGQSYLSIMEDNITDDVSLVILPETPLLEGYEPDKSEFSDFAEFAKKHNCTVISGCFLRGNPFSYNCQYAILPDGEISGFYCKQVLVPFGEVDPIAYIMGKKTLAPCSEDKYTKPLDCGKFKLGCSICIESIYSGISRKNADNAADILCVSTNDSWFGKSGGRIQHYRHCMLRAAECGKYLVRAGNCGVSSVIAPNGEVIKEKTDSGEGAVISRIIPIKSKTPYVKWGNITLIIPVLLIGASLLKSVASLIKKIF